MRFFTRKRLLVFFAFIAIVLLAVVGGLFVYINSPGFEADARNYIISQIEKKTGADVTLKHFEWSLSRQRFHLDDLVLRGLEPRDGPPLATFPSIDIGLNLRSILQRKLNLFELTLTRPEFHILVDPKGKTNFPTPPDQGPAKSFDFQISIENFRIIQGTTFLNERQIDTDFVLANLSSEMTFHSTTGVLTSHLRYDGQFTRPEKPTIPYTFDADMDFTKGTLLAKRIDLRTGDSGLKLQGRINDLLSRNLAGRLEYSGNVKVPFLNYFFTDEKFGGSSDVAGFMEFSNGYFFTSGNAGSNSVEYDGWVANDFKTEYSYHFPEKRASFRKLRANIAGGQAAGSIAIEEIPGPSRIILDIDYSGIDSAALARVSPWDPKYHVYSRLTGTLQGWFEGKMERYLFAGDATFQPYTPKATPPNAVPLSLDGKTDYKVQPKEVRIANGDVRFGRTHLTAEGLIHESASDLRVAMDSADLRDGYFVYDDANGSGSFLGTLTGPIKNPVVDGDFQLVDHVYKQKWSIEKAAGHVRLDTLTEVAELKNVKMDQGRSEIIVGGTTELDGSPADLTIQAVRVYGEDLKPYSSRKIGGLITGMVRLTSFDPMKVEGDLRADDFQIDDRDVGNARGHLRYFDPVLELETLSIARNGSTLTGNVSYNSSSTALKFSTHISAVDFEELRWLGLPNGLSGTVRQADLQGDGTVKQPNVRGNGVIQNLSFKDVVFPMVRVDVTSNGPTLTTNINAAQNLTLTAQVNTAATGYPFTAQGSFNNYGLAQIAGLTDSTLNVTGTINVEGSLSDSRTLKGQGRIDSSEANIQGQDLRTTTPFAFSFNPDQLTLSSITLTGTATKVSIDGTIGLTGNAGLGLNVKGNVDLALLAATNTDWIAGGSVTIDGQIRGTPNNPDLRGFARFSNASLGRRGVFTSLSALNGDLAFDENRITLNDVRGTVGGGSVQLQGNALIQQRQIQSMNVRIDANSVRLRYPQGLRSVVNGGLVLRGSLDSPLLEGNLEIESMSYKSNFDEFLAMFTNASSAETPPSLRKLRLALHVEGGRNITIQNQLADVEARVDLDIKGTVDNPSLTGHVEASGGTLTFQGKRYTITRGNVDFTDPLSIVPTVDIQAETEVRDYRIILAITGRGDNLHLDLRSDPALSQFEIVSLIAGGKTRQELADSATGSKATTSGAALTDEALFKGGAASILSDLLAQRIAGSAFEKLVPGRVRIGPDPDLISVRNQTTLRLTYDLQVSSSMSLTLSQDLAAGQSTIIQIEYFVTKNTSILASRDETNSYSFDVKFRRRYK